MPTVRRYPGAVPSIPFSWLIWIKAIIRRWSRIRDAMEHRAQFLRLQIALYRRYMADGAIEELARRYMTDILRAKLELAEIEKDSRKSGWDRLTARSRSFPAAELAEQRVE